MGLESNCVGHYPNIADTAYVHPTAVLIGRVIVEAGVFIGPQAVIRADEPGPDGAIEPITIGRKANIQDGVIIHAIGGTGVTIGPHTSIAHGALVHGPCEIGQHCFVGFLSIVFRATLEDEVVVLHRAMVEDVTVPRGLLVPSAGIVQSAFDVRKLKSATSKIVAFTRKVSQANVWLAKSGLQDPQEAGPHCVFPPEQECGHCAARRKGTHLRSPVRQESGLG